MMITPSAFFAIRLKTVGSLVPLKQGNNMGGAAECGIGIIIVHFAF